MSFMSQAQLKYHEKESFTPEVHSPIDAFTTGWIKMDQFCSVTLNETPVNVFLRGSQKKDPVWTRWSCFRRIS